MFFTASNRKEAIKHLFFHLKMLLICLNQYREKAFQKKDNEIVCFILTVVLPNETFYHFYAKLTHFYPTWISINRTQKSFL